MSKLSELASILVQGTKTRSIGARTREVAKVKSCGDVTRLGKGKVGIIFGGGVDGELLPELLSPVRGRGDGDVPGLLAADESLDTFMDLKCRFGLLSSNSSVTDNDAKSFGLS